MLAGRSDKPYLFEFEFSRICRAVHSVGILREVGMTGVDVGYPEHEISVILLKEG